MATWARRAWLHVKYTSADLRRARESAERDNARVRESQEREQEFQSQWEHLDSHQRRISLLQRSMFFEPRAIVDPDLALPRRKRWQDPGSFAMWKDRYVLGIGIVIVVSIIAVLVFGIRGIVHNVQHRECPRKAAAMGVEAQWVDYSFFGWSCLANIEGRWVPIDTVNNDTGVWIRNGGR